MNIKHIKILLIALVNTQVINAQNIIKYSELTNMANLSIVDGDYTKALCYFDSAFATAPQPYTIDITNALKCECLSERNNLEQKMLTLFKRGLTINDFNDDKVLRKCIRKSKEYPKYLDLSDVINKNLDDYLDTDYRNELVELEKKDQYYRLKKGSYSVYRREIDSMDKENVTTLLNLINTKGFPSEEKVGVKNIYGYQNWRIVILHYNQQRSNSNDEMPDLFSPHLYDATRNMQLLPYELSYLIALQNDTAHKDDGGFFLIQKLKKNHYVMSKTIKYKFEAYNEVRIPLGLDPIEDYIKKALFCEEKKHDFIFYISSAIFDISSFKKADKKFFIERSERIK
jgi:hypothetical protein